jgi:prevent-host-death family protein
MDAKVSANTWKLQDAKARLSELVRLARVGDPQKITVHGKEAVVVVDSDRFEVRPKARSPIRTMADFIKRAQKLALPDDVEFDRPLYMDVRVTKLPALRRRKAK